MIVLALGSAPRPAGIAALYALLSARHPRRVLFAFVAAGFTFSVGLGVLVVAVFRGADLAYGSGPVESLIELLAGVAALGFALGVSTGKAQPPSPSQGGAADRGSAIVRRLQQPSVMTAAMAGVGTHLPGLFYLVALNAIVAHGGSVADGVLQVLVFNVIWFGAAFASVVIFLLRPGAARRALGRANAWARRHARATTIVVFAVVGSYLTVSGVAGLVD